MLVEVPVIIVSLVKEVQTIEAFDPANLYVDVEVFLVVVEAAALRRFLELVDADRVGFRNDGPIGRVAVDARNLVGGKLENLVFDSRPFDCEGTDGACDEQRNRSD